MKPHRILSLVAALGLFALVVPGGRTLAAAPAAVQVVQLTLINTLCPGYTVVPANTDPTTFDQTGGHAGQLDTSYQRSVVNPATDIPPSCAPADGWQFQMYSDPGLTTPDRSPLTTGADGAGTGSVTIVLTPTEVALAQTTGVPTGLWIAEILQPSVAGFGELRCFTDILNGDDRENVHGLTPNDTHIYCIAYNVLPPATYHALSPTRILDTRNGTGLSGVFSSHVARTFQVTGGASGVPANATAVTGNLTVTQQTSPGFLFIGPIATDNPTSSTLNFPLGDDRANAVTVALGAGGTLSVTYAAPTGGPTAQVIFDVTGYFTPDTTGATYFPLTPARILDSRSGTGLSGLFSSHVARTFQVTGVDGIPANATAVTGNLTVTQQTSLGFLFLGPVATDNPTSSTINFPLGDDRANAATVALGAGGTLSVTYAAPTLGPTAQVIFDVTGYFTPDQTGVYFVPLAPTRILDSRSGTGLSGLFSSHVARTFQVTGQGRVPTSATAVTGNLTVTQQTSLGFLFIGPVATDNPTSSTLNFPLGDDRANADMLAVGAGGTLSVTYAAPALGRTAQVIFDVSGYFVPAGG